MLLTIEKEPHAKPAWNPSIVSVDSTSSVHGLPAARSWPPASNLSYDSNITVTPSFFASSSSAAFKRSLGPLNKCTKRKERYALYLAKSGLPLKMRSALGFHCRSSTTSSSGSHSGSSSSFMASGPMNAMNQLRRLPSKTKIKSPYNSNEMHFYNNPFSMFTRNFKVNLTCPPTIYMPTCTCTQHVGPRTDQALSVFHQPSTARIFNLRWPSDTLRPSAKAANAPPSFLRASVVSMAG